MARAIWSGSISFGLLNVPVKLYSAVSKQSVRFRELREGDGSRVKHKRVAESDGKEVPYEKIVKGYEYAPDQYVVLSRDELAELEPRRPGRSRSRTSSTSTTSTRSTSSSPTTSAPTRAPSAHTRCSSRR